MHLPTLSKITLTAACLALLTIAGQGASAQTVYRIVGPDGKVSFSDQPPPPAAAGKASVSTGGRAASGASAGAGLPYELQQIVRRFPVTLYTAPDCNPCAAARNLLVSRGVPFSERTITTNEDIDALKRISGESNLPFGTIGGQQLKGFSDVEWTQYLDAAAYPKTSQLPPTYRAPAATPLVAAKPLDAPAAAPSGNASPAAQADQQPRNAPSNTNPAGIQF
ncbi:NrdH-redoxin [Rhodoferax koreense]|uniref:NrdH-redoxin n=1 Tax=Rhodoferax koreensis TaxID=1842727 RepID=A0A1P8K417_9BURK|nr:glutaredoxin family protein [Rhodoferax koreense]APW40737.1 NrdH-redoxin [Rhodoferax koreense]